MEMAWVVSMRAGCTETCRKIAGEDELVHDADVVRAVVDAA